MTTNIEPDTIELTADAYRTAAAVSRHHTQYGWADHYEHIADRIDAAQARDTEVKPLVDLMLMALDNEPPPPIERVSANAGRRARVENGVRAVLDHLASRLAPDNGITLTADEAADVRKVCAGTDESIGYEEFCAAQDRLRARFAPTEQAETKPEPDEWDHLQDIPDGVRFRGDGRRANRAIVFVKSDGKLINLGSYAKFDGMVVDTSVLDGDAPFVRVDAPEKPEPRSWPSLDQVPDGVVVEGRGGYPRYTAGQVDYPERTGHEGPFTEVVGGAL